MVKISNASYENEIHRVGKPFQRGFQKYIFLGQGGANFGGGTAGKYRENGQKQGTYCYANWRVVGSNRDYDLYSLVSKSLHYLQFESVFRQNFALTFQALPSLKLGTFFIF